MSPTDGQLRAPSDYDEIAALQGRRSLLYVRSGDYQGDWLMFALGGDTDEYAIYRDYYGSCSGCDSLQGAFGYSGSLYPRETVLKFAANYSPFALIPRETARNLAARESLLTVFPANVRDISIDTEAFAHECELLIRLEEEMPLTIKMALSSNNQETRRRIMEKCGVEKAIRKLISVEEETGDELVECWDGGIYLHLHDPSTPREYLLRVPPEYINHSVRAAKAWSFNIPTSEYEPLIET